MDAVFGLRPLRKFCYPFGGDCSINAATFFSLLFPESLMTASLASFTPAHRGFRPWVRRLWVMVGFAVIAWGCVLVLRRFLVIALRRVAGTEGWPFSWMRRCRFPSGAVRVGRRAVG